jgi:hypothetical protein
MVAGLGGRIAKTMGADKRLNIRINSESGFISGSQEHLCRSQHQSDIAHDPRVWQAITPLAGETTASVLDPMPGRSKL